VLGFLILFEDNLEKLPFKGVKKQTHHQINNGDIWSRLQSMTGKRKEADHHEIKTMKMAPFSF
jgi:hypothetical protein